MKASKGALFPRLTVLIWSRCSGCSSVSDGQRKSKLTHVHVAVSLQLKKEVMSSSQLALTCCIVWRKKKRKKEYGAEVEPNSNLAELLTIFLALGFGCRQTKGIRCRSSPSYQSMSLILQRIHADGCALSILRVQFCSQICFFISAITIVGLIVEKKACCSW